MKRIFSFLCGGLLVGLLAPLASGQTPVVQPKSSQSTAGAEAALPRLIDELKSTDAKVRAQAIAALGAMGATAKPAAPALIETAVNTTDHVAALQALVKIDEEATRAALRRLLVVQSARCRCGTSFGVVVASAGEPIVPTLIAMLPEKERTAQIENVLAQIGAPAVPHLVKTLGAIPPQETQISVFKTLAAMGPIAKSAVPALDVVRRCEPESVKIQRAFALIRITGDHPASVAVLHDAVKNGEKAQKLEALACLQASRVKAKELVPTMVSFLEGDDTAYHWGAAQTLINIGPDAVPALVQSITMPGCKKFTFFLYTQKGQAHPKHTQRVLETLHRMGPNGSDAIELFARMVADRGPLAIYAANALPNFGPKAKDAIPALLEALKADSVDLRLSSAATLVRIDRQQATHTVPVLVAVMQGKNANERDRAVWLLARLGADAKPAVPAIHALLKTESLQFRLELAAALARIDPTAAEPAMPTLIEALAAKGDAADFAVDIVGQIGPKAKAAVPALKAMLAASLKDENHPVNPRMIVQTVKKIDASVDIMPILIDALNSADANRRQDAARLVRQFRGPQTLASLESAMQDGQLASSAEVTGLLKTLRNQ